MTTQVSPQPAANADVTTSYAAALASRNAAANAAQKNGSPNRSTNGSPAPNGVKEDGGKKNGARKDGRKGSAAAKESKEEVNGQAEEKDEKKDEKKEFVPAPPPKVNVWKARQEEKSKAVPATSQPEKPAEKKEEVKKEVVEQKEKKEEGSGKGKGRRHNTQEESDLAPPPPVNDVSAWPTPDLAQEEFKKEKVEEKEREAKPASSGGRGKWVPVAIETPYVSPIPKAGGRGRGRGGREGGNSRGGAANAGGDRADRAQQNGGNAEGDRGRQNSGTNSRGGYQGGRGGKRASSTGAYNSRRDSRPNNGAADKEAGKNKGKDGAEWKEWTPENGSSAPATTQSEKPRRASRDTARNGEEQQFSQENRHHSEGGNSDYRGFNGPNYGNGRPQWQFGPGENGHQYQQRERGNERGRGGYRGRGGFHHYQNGHQNGAGYPGAPPQQYPGQAANGAYAHHQARGGSYRGRPQNFNPQFRYNTTMVPPQPYGVPAYGGGYEYSMVPSIPPLAMEGLVQQINYYFSVENLCKDIYLRKHMNGQGFVRLDFIHSFNRVKNVTKDPMVLRDACLQSQEVEIVQGQDGVYIRKRDGWETWILREEEREQVARQEVHIMQINEEQLRQQQQQQHYQNMTSPGEMSANAPPFFPGAPQQMHGYYPQPMEHQYHMQPPPSNLSPNVPDFTPHAAQQTNGTHKGIQILDHQLDELADENSLVVVSKKPVSDSTPGSPEAAIRQANGVASLTEKLQASSLTNGDGAHDENAPKTGYTMDATMSHRSYSEVRALVEQHRAAHGSQRNGDLITLYKFWSHVLVNTFKTTMYKDFLRLAVEDADAGERIGLEELFKFFERYVRSRNTVGRNVLYDFVNAARVDAKHASKTGVDTLRKVLNNSAVHGAVKHELQMMMQDPELQKAMQTGEAEMSPATEAYTTLVQQQ